MPEKRLRSGKQRGVNVSKAAAPERPKLGTTGKFAASLWQRNLHSYEKTAIHFVSKEDLDYLIDMIWGEEELYRMPHLPAGDNTLIVPRDALKTIECKLKHKRSFTVQNVIDPRSLPAQRAVRLQQDRNSV